MYILLAFFVVQQVLIPSLYKKRITLIKNIAITAKLFFYIFTFSRLVLNIFLENEINKVVDFCRLNGEPFIFLHINVLSKLFLICLKNY